MIEIHMYDMDEKILAEMTDYCIDNNLSLNKFECIDISDFSGIHDTMLIFEFIEETDALMFKLKWGKYGY